MHALHATFAPLAYLLSAVFLFLGLKAAIKTRIAARGCSFGVLALIVGLTGALFDIGTVPSSGFWVAVLGGGLVGAFLATGISAATPATRVTWIAGLGNASVATVAAGVLVEGGLSVSRLIAAGLALFLGLVGAGAGFGATLRGSTSVAANVAAALTAALGGWALAFAGFALSNILLLLAGGVGGTAAFAMARLIAAASGRSLVAALFSGAKPSADAFGYTNVRSCGAEEVAMVLETAANVIVVPGFGMARAGAQHPVKEMVELLEKNGAKVLYAVHPAAGCVPGHMNIALDEANIPHQPVLDAEQARALIRQADAVLVVGANDVVNTAGSNDPKSPLYGLEAFDLSETRAVFVVKRSLRPGAAGVKNPLFEQPNTTVLFGDAKRVLQSLVAELKGAAH